MVTAPPPEYVAIHSRWCPSFPRSRFVAAGSLVSLAALATLAPYLGPFETGALIALSIGLAFVPGSDPAARTIAALAAALAATVPLSFLGVPWQALMAVALGVWGLLARRSPALAPSPAWRARGELPWAWTVIVAGVTPLALVGWLVVMGPDLSDVVGAYVPDLPFPVLVLGAVLFALVNATGEELIWRGVFQDRLAPLLGLRMAIAVQAVSFGVQHAHGVPRGVVGVVLAGTWAAMLGALRARSGGLLAPIAAHVVADAVIATIVLGLARG